MARPQRTPEEIEAMQTRILEAAHDLVHEAGPDAGTMRRIAGALGVSPMALYSYFPTRQAILNALGEQQIARMLARRQEQIRRAQEGDVALILRDELAHFALMAYRRPEMYRLIIRCTLSEASQPEAPRFRRHIHAHLAHLGDLVAVGIQQGHFAPRDPELAALTILSMISGLLFMQLAGLPFDEERFGALVDDTLEAITCYLTRSQSA
jgi:AcrR family transcriptional regulator